MSDCVFFYGTLRAGFSRRPRLGVDSRLTFIGRGSIAAALYDLGLYPAAIPDPDARVYGEVYRMSDPDSVLAVLDDIEGYRPAEPDRSLYIRSRIPITLDDGGTEEAWVYFYNAPLGRAPRIASGDYLAHLELKLDARRPV
jgi:gamma-glutamylcyclotransferase (GGCT)/AIG2-like uncharacterized protein YtfP